MNDFEHCLFFLQARGLPKAGSGYAKVLSMLSSCILDVTFHN